LIELQGVAGRDRRSPPSEAMTPEASNKSI